MLGGGGAEEVGGDMAWAGMLLFWANVRSTLALVCTEE